MNQKSLWLCFCFCSQNDVIGNIWNLLFTEVQQQHHWNQFYHHLQTAPGCANKTGQNWWHGFESYCCHKRISSACTYIHGTYNQIQGQTNQWCKLNRKYLPTIKPWYIWNSPIVNSNRSKNCKIIINNCAPYDISLLRNDILGIFDLETHKLIPIESCNFPAF